MTRARRSEGFYNLIITRHDSVYSLLMNGARRWTYLLDILCALSLNSQHSLFVKRHQIETLLDFICGHFVTCFPTWRSIC
jgi:hypothetical protein